MQNEESNLIELLDEEGNTVTFEHLATLEHEGNYYIVLSEVDADTDEDADVDVVIMKIEQDEDGADVYVYEEDEELQEVLFEKFLQLMDEAEGGEE